MSSSRGSNDSSQVSPVVNSNGGVVSQTAVMNINDQISQPILLQNNDVVIDMINAIHAELSQAFIEEASRGGVRSKYVYGAIWEKVKVLIEAYTRGGTSENELESDFKVASSNVVQVGPLKKSYSNLVELTRVFCLKYQANIVDTKSDPSATGKVKLGNWYGYYQMAKYFTNDGFDVIGFFSNEFYKIFSKDQNGNFINEAKKEKTSWKDIARHYDLFEPVVELYKSLALLQLTLIKIKAIETWERELSTNFSQIDEELKQRFGQQVGADDNGQLNYQLRINLSLSGITDFKDLENKLSAIEQKLDNADSLCESLLSSPSSQDEQVSARVRDVQIKKEAVSQALKACTVYRSVKLDQIDAALETLSSGGYVSVVTGNVATARLRVKEIKAFIQDYKAKTGYQNKNSGQMLNVQSNQQPEPVASPVASIAKNKLPNSTVEVHSQTTKKKKSTSKEQPVAAPVIPEDISTQQNANSQEQPAVVASAQQNASADWQPAVVVSMQQSKKKKKSKKRKQSNDQSAVVVASAQQPVQSQDVQPVVVPEAPQSVQSQDVQPVVASSAQQIAKPKPRSASFSQASSALFAQQNKRQPAAVVASAQQADTSSQQKVSSQEQSVVASVVSQDVQSVVASAQQQTAQAAAPRLSNQPISEQDAERKSARSVASEVSSVQGKEGEKSIKQPGFFARHWRKIAGGGFGAVIGGGIGFLVGAILIPLTFGTSLVFFTLVGVSAGASLAGAGVGAGVGTARDRRAAEKYRGKWLDAAVAQVQAKEIARGTTTVAYQVVGVPQQQKQPAPQQGQPAPQQQKQPAPQQQGQPAPQQQGQEKNASPRTTPRSSHNC